MAAVAILVFVGVFAVIAALLMLGDKDGNGSSKKQRAATLEAALGSAAVEKKKPVTLDLRKNELGSTLPWLNGLMDRFNVAPRVQKLLNQANLSWTPGRMVLTSAACLAVGGYLAYMRTDAALVGLIAGVVCGALPMAFVWFKRSQRFGKFEKGLPDALELMVGALRVGHSFNSVMGLVTRECPDPVGSEFRVVFDEQNFGLDIRTSLNNLCDRVPLQDLRIAVTAILIQRESGGNLAEVLEKTAHVIRERFRLKKQVMVHTAQGRLTGIILAALPVVLGVALYFVNPENMSLLWKRDMGIKMLYGAGVMLTVGTVLIQKIVRMDV